MEVVHGKHGQLEAVAVAMLEGMEEGLRATDARCQHSLWLCKSIMRYLMASCCQPGSCVAVGDAVVYMLAKLPITK